MPFCHICGTPMEPTARFCLRCGTPAAQSQPNPQPNPQPAPAFQPVKATLYEGQARDLTFLGVSFTVSPEMDTFNHYRKEFRQFARQQSGLLRSEYFRRVRNLDAFLTDFPVMYTFYRKSIIDAAVDLLGQADLYDISPQQFEDQHSKDFCLCGEDIDVMIDSFNKTIEANQQRKAHNYNMMPGMIFSGLGGFVTALAVNVAVNQIAEADIRNANVTPSQRVELFQRINPNLLMQRAFLDYWRVFLSLTWQMNRRGLPVWYPNETSNQRATGIFQNLSAGRIPEHKAAEAVVSMLQLNPYDDNYMPYLLQRYGRTEETKEIFDYFGYEG